MKRIVLGILFIAACLVGVAQPPNDACATPESLCGANLVNGTTANATSNTSEDGGPSCFSFEKTVWYTFTTNPTGGNVQINVTNVNCTGTGNNLSGIIYSAGSRCDNGSYTQVSNCETGSLVGFSLTASGLAPNSTFYMVITSGKDCDFDVQASGPGLSTSANPSVSVADDAGGRICEQTPVTFTATTAECANAQFNWNVNGTVVASSSDNTYTSTAIKDGDNVSVDITCDCGAPATSNQIIMSTFDKEAEAGDNKVIPSGGSVTLDGDGGTNPVWSPSESLDDNQSYTPTASPDQTTQYTITVTAGNGCVFTDTVTVFVVDSVEVPNTFTPNGDGINDTWDIDQVENFPDIKIVVYSRWGQEVYKTIGYPVSKRWNGTHNGGTLPAGTYYYIIDLSASNDTDKLVKGSVTIIY